MSRAGVEQRRGRDLGDASRSSKTGVAGSSPAAPVILESPPADAGMTTFEDFLFPSKRPWGRARHVGRGGEPHKHKTYVRCLCVRCQACVPANLPKPVEVCVIARPDTVTLCAVR
jgi:hypothetical protein